MELYNYGLASPEEDSQVTAFKTQMGYLCVPMVGHWVRAVAPVLLNLLSIMEFLSYKTGEGG